MKAFFILNVFLLCSTISSQFYKCTDCFCLPSDGPDGNCPELGNRELSYPPETIERFMTLQLATECNEIPHLIPVTNDSYDPCTAPAPSCTPYPFLENLLNLPLCVEPESTEGVCGFLYSDNSCSPERTYEMKTYKNANKAVDDGAIVTHLGACGVCSNSNDLAINMMPDLEISATSCAMLAPDFLQIYICYQTIGFTPECAWLWASNALNTAINCSEICQALMNTPIQDPETCELNNCFMCDDVQSGSIFSLFSGRTRRNSGIITPIARDCSSIANINQDPCPGESTKKNKCTNLIPETDNFRSWSSDVTTFTPVFRPINDEELVTIVEKSKKIGCKIRMKGAGHSEGGIVMQRREEDIVVISLASHTCDIEGWNDSINPETSTFRIGAGKSWYDVSVLIRPHGFIIKNRLAGKFFSVGGVIANNAHGGGRALGFAHDDVVKLLVLTSDGVFKEVEGEDLKYWRNSAGQLGMIVAVEMSMHSEAIPAVIGIDTESGEPILDKTKGGLNMERSRFVFSAPTSENDFGSFVRNVTSKALETNAMNDNAMFFFNPYINHLAAYSTNFFGHRFSGFDGPFADDLLATKYKVASETSQQNNLDAAFNGGSITEINEDDLCNLFCVPPSAPPSCIPIPSQTEPGKLLCEVPLETAIAISVYTLDEYDTAWDHAASTCNDGYADFLPIPYSTLNIIFPARAFAAAFATWYQVFTQLFPLHNPNSNLVFRFINPLESAVMNPIPTSNEIKNTFDEKHSFLPNAYDTLIPPLPNNLPDGLVVFDIENLQNIYDDTIDQYLFALQEALRMIPSNPLFPYSDNVLPECDISNSIFLCNGNSDQKCCNPPIPAIFGHLGKSWAYQNDPTTTPTTGKYVQFKDNLMFSNTYRTKSISDFNHKRDELSSDLYAGGALMRWLNPAYPNSEFEIRKLTGQSCSSETFSLDPDKECISDNCVDTICCANRIRRLNDLKEK